MSAGKEGIEYERKINATLKKAKLQKMSFSHDPTDNDSADAVFKYDGEEWNLEVKHVYNTSFGSYTVKHNGKKWVLAEPKTGQHALHKALKLAKVEDEINRFYKDLGIPFIFKEKKLTPEQKQYDIDTFGGKTLNIPIGANAAAQYYAAKHVNYIQIRNLGFFYLLYNPAKIDCPKLNIPGMAGELRLKKENKNGNTNYRFVIQIKPVGASPKKSKRDIDIDTEFLKQDKK